MRLREHDNLSPFLRVFTDLLFNILIILVLVLALIAQLVKKINEDQREEKTPEQMVMMMPIDSVLLFSIRWPPGIQDIDLWAIGPDDVPVSYNNTRSGVLGYFRDDVGIDYADRSQESTKNYELISAPSFVPGHYVVNVYFFANHGKASPVTVECQILIKSGSGVAEVYRGKVTLAFTREEKTIIQFDLIQGFRGEFVVDKSSISHEFRSVIQRL